jgi:hypothetical protein
VTDHADHKRHLADLPTDERRARDVARDRELGEGLTRRHVTNADYARRHIAHQFDRLLRAAPVLGSLLRRG